jgi:glutaredoxin 3
MAKLKTVIFTMTDCPFCARAKEILAEMGVEYEERNVSMSIKHRNDLVKRTNDTKLPTVLINKELLVKPGEDKLRATINYERHR